MSRPPGSGPTCRPCRSPPPARVRSRATGTPADTERLKGLGAAAVLDYPAAPVADQVRAASPGGIDALIDLVSYAPDDLPLTTLRKGGKVASSLGAASDEALTAD